jgi:hypothetical protein
VPRFRSRREFARALGLSAAAVPFVLNLPSLAAREPVRKKRLVIVFSPNGVVPERFWPKETGDTFALSDTLKPLEPFRKQLLVLRGVHDQVRGDGDAHMRGMGCLLTGTELNPGNIQGGSETPAGWSKGHSIDQELRAFLQKDAATKTRFGSLEFGALVPDRADTWTRMVYAGNNQPVAPIDDPHQMFAKLYGRVKDRELLGSVLDVVTADLKRIERAVPADDRRLVQEHAAAVRELERDTRAAAPTNPAERPPEVDPTIRRDNDLMPKISAAQIDLLVRALAADFTRVATLQYTAAVGNVRMRWLGIDDQHHELSHNDSAPAQAQLTKINTWFCEQVALLAKRLSETPEPGGTGSLLDSTQIVWTNELGQGSSHTLDNIPFVLVGGGLGFKTGRALNFGGVPHNRLLLALAHGFGHELKAFGTAAHCTAGPLALA